MYKEKQNFIYIGLAKKIKYTYTEKRILIHENKTKPIYSKNKYFDLKKSRKYLYIMFWNYIERKKAILYKNRKKEKLYTERLK